MPETTTLVIGDQAHARLTAMLATWYARQEVIDREAYIAEHHNHDLAEARLLQEQRKDLDRSVVHALCSMIRLGGVVWPDNQDPPSLIVNAERIQYGVSVLRQLDMKWSVDS